MNNNPLSCELSSLLQLKGSIKNIHSVNCLSLYKNEQIFIVYESYIHIHSLRRISQSLPSLVYTIDLLALLADSSEESYQDKLSKSISETDKSDLGKVIFTQKLNSQQNIFMKINSLQKRLEYLGSQNPNIKSLKINEGGDLLILFDDCRCLMLKRKSPQTFNQSYVNLYCSTDQIILNSYRNRQIYLAQFCKIENNPNFMIWLQTHKSKEEDLQMEIGSIQVREDKIVLNEETLKQKGKKNQQIKKQGLINFVYHAANQLIFLCYYNKVKVMSLSKQKKNKNKKITFLATHLQSISLLHATNQQHIISYFHHSLPHFSLFAASSQKILSIQFDGKTQKVKKVCDFPVKTNPILITEQGKYIGGSSNSLFCSETCNGIVVQLTANNYSKEGGLKISHYSLEDIFYKSMFSFKNEYVDFNDLQFLYDMTKKSQTKLGKYFVEQLNKFQKEGEQDSLISSFSFSQQQINTILINVYVIFNLNPQILQRLISEKIQEKTKKDYSLIKNRCYFSGEQIILQDILYCSHCNLYAIKQIVQKRVCYICKHLLSQIQ